MRTLGRIPRRLMLLGLLTTLALGACGDGLAPPEEQGARFLTAVTCVQESLAVADPDQVQVLRQSALEAAEEVDPQRLQRLHVAMPRHFRGALQPGLRLWVRGAQKQDADLLARGELAILRWDDWYQEARREIVPE